MNHIKSWTPWPSSPTPTPPQWSSSRPGLSPVLQPDKGLSSTAATNLLQVVSNIFIDECFLKTIFWFFTDNLRYFLRQFYFSFLYILQHFSLLSPGVFPGWLGPTRYFHNKINPVNFDKYWLFWTNMDIFSSNISNNLFLPAAVQALLPILQPPQPWPATDMADRFFPRSFFFVNFFTHFFLAISTPLFLWH